MSRAVLDIGGAAAKKAVEVTPQDFQVDGFPLVDHLFKRCQGTDSALAGPARLAKVSYLHRNVEDSAGRSGGILPEESTCITGLHESSLNLLKSAMTALY